MAVEEGMRRGEGGRYSHKFSLSLTWTDIGLIVVPFTGMSLSAGSEAASTLRGKVTWELRVSR